MKILKKVLVLMALLVMTLSAGMYSAGASKVINPKQIKLNKTSVSLEKGKTATLSATISPSNATNKSVTWKSSNANVAKVSSKGKITAVKAGTATITATTKNSKKATCKVTVKNNATATKSTAKKSTAKKSTATKKTNVAQIGNKNYTSLKSALKAVKKDNKQQTIKLLKNISQSDGFTIAKGQNIVLDTGKYSLKVSKGIVNKGKLKVQGSGAFASTKADKGIQNEGTLTISGNVKTSEIDNYKTLKVTGGNIKGGIGNTGTVTISGKTAVIESEKEYSSKANSASDTITNFKTLKISGGTIKSESGTSVKNVEGATLKLTGGTITSTKGYAIYNSGKVTNSGGIISGKTKGMKINAQNVKSKIAKKKETNKTLISNEGMTGLNKAPRVSEDTTWSPTGKNPEKYIAFKISDGVKIDSVTDSLKVLHNNGYSTVPESMNKKSINDKVQYRYVKASDLKFFTNGIKTATISVTAKDNPQGLKSKTTFKLTFKGDNKWTVNQSTRVNYSSNNGKLNLILTDYNGIANGKAKIKIIDKNTGKTIKTLSASKLAKDLKSTTKYKGNIVNGVYSFDISKLTAKDGKYRIQVSTTDASGMSGDDMIQFTNGIKATTTASEPNEEIEETEETMPEEEIEDTILDED